ncbi:hypothetical protein ACFQKD_12880 [Halobaculum marinum]|uniref:Uncharacterized protein n=1 Tax=Halobaculum marinum TaxID=3031996 RepID=A0ABD5X0X8_9EURY|nr:hypothetical protein [Halobaculum sp. DT55]
MTWVAGSSVGAGSYLGVVARWVAGAVIWYAYAVVHLTAPIADIRAHPNRHSWGPFETINVYTYISVRQIAIRLFHGVIGFVLAFLGTLVFVSTPPLLVLPVAVMLTTVLLMGAHIGVKDPSAETLRHL